MKKLSVRLLVERNKTKRVGGNLFGIFFFCCDDELLLASQNLGDVHKRKRILLLFPKGGCRQTYVSLGNRQFGLRSLLPSTFIIWLREGRKNKNGLISHSALCVDITNNSYLG